MKFHEEVEINPIDLSRIHIDLLKNYPIEKMEIGDFCRFHTQEYGESVIYQIKKLDNENLFFKSFEIKKYVFNQVLFDLEVRQQLKNPKIEINVSKDELKNFIGTEVV